MNHHIFFLNNQYILRDYLFESLIPNTSLYNSISLNENKIRSIYNKNYNLALSKFTLSGQLFRGAKR